MDALFRDTRMHMNEDYYLIHPWGTLVVEQCFPSQDELGVQKNVQYTQRSHFIICTIWVDIGHLWTPKHPLGQTVL